MPRRREHPAAAEGEQLLDQLRRSRRGRADLLELGVERAVGADLLGEQLGVARHDRVQVVELVRDPAGEAADPFEPVRLPEPLLELLPPGDVEQVSAGRLELAVRVPPLVRLVLHPDDAAVLRDQPVLGAPVLGVVADLLEHPLPVVGVEDLGEELAVLEPLLDGVAEQWDDLRAAEDRRAPLVLAVDVGDDRYLLDEAAILRLRLAQTLAR